MLPPLIVVVPVTPRLASERVPPTAPPKLASPETVKLSLPAVRSLTVLLKVIPLLSIKVVFDPSVMAPLKVVAWSRTMVPLVVTVPKA